MPLTLYGSVGYDEENDPDDVAQTGTALATLGRLDALGAAQSGQFDGALDGAIRAYQSDNDLDDDGILLPNGPTQQSINAALTSHRPGPSLLANDFSSGETSHFGAAKAPHETGLRPQDGLSSAPRKRLQNSLFSAGALTGTFAQPAIGGRDQEQIMKSRGYRYSPDPMGRINRGDWINELGHRIGADEALAMLGDTVGAPTPERREVIRESSNAEAVTVIASRPSRPRRITSNLDDFAHDLDTASASVKRGDGNVRIALTLAPDQGAPQDANALIPRINAAIREAVVANALMHRSTRPDEIASIVASTSENPSSGPPLGRSRIKEMLIEAAANGATAEQRLHARGLLAVYQMEEREAKIAGAEDPRAEADSAIGMFGAGLSGDVSWSVYDPDQDDGAAEPIADDPENPRRPRGMHNPNTREAVREGKRRHEELRERVRLKGRGWHTEGYRDERTGRWYRPDVTTRRGYLLELKPDTPSGRAAGERQCAEYYRATGRRCRAIYYPPQRDASAKPIVPTDPNRGSIASPGGSRTGSPMFRSVPGGGSNRVHNPKVRGPIDLID